MINRTNTKQMPLNIVGSSVFGRYPKISIEKTYNMLISDNWMVNYPGYSKVIDLNAFNNVSQLYKQYGSIMSHPAYTRGVPLNTVITPKRQEGQ